MYKLDVPTINGIVSESVYTIEELPLLGKLLSCKDSKKRKVNYLEIPCAFDIETTNIYKKEPDGSISEDFRPYAFMYHWQFCIDDCVCFGRTWEEFRQLLETLEKKMNLSLENRLVIFVHNLPFEWAFMSRFIDYYDGFFREERKPLKVITKGGIEFRCSYALSNMSLNKFCQNEENVIHYKLSGDDYNYTKIRTPKSHMENNELAYCYNDVRGLCECITSRLRFDTLGTLPMTSTGYVRRDLRKAVKGDKKYRERFRSNALTAPMYKLCREAFRGGDTHANINYSNQLLTSGVTSKDITSSYPASMMMDLYPQTEFMKINVSTFLNRDMSDFALLMEVRLVDARYIGACGIPYIALSKCRAYSSDKVVDNGRIIAASLLEFVCTDIDYNIIMKEYSFSDIYIKNIYGSRYAPLSDRIKNTVMDYYRGKTLLKGNKEKVYEYMKSKNSLNSTYGCMVMRIDQTEVKYNPVTHEYMETVPDLSETLAKFYKSRNSFLSYQHGVWITANSRRRLREMLWTVGKDVVYCDTDSIKYIGDHEKDFQEKNKEIINKAMECGAYATDANGNTYYMGVWDDDGHYEQFKTLGAKKYVYMEGGQIHSTIAGVSKRAGVKYFEENGLEAFAIGNTIPDSGHLTAYYNDEGIHKITVKGHTFTTASNVALIDNTYTIGVTNEYLDLLEKALDNMEDIDYI